MSPSGIAEGHTGEISGLALAPTGHTQIIKSHSQLQATTALAPLAASYSPDALGALPRIVSFSVLPGEGNVSKISFNTCI